VTKPAVIVTQLSGAEGNLSGQVSIYHCSGTVSVTVHCFNFDPDRLSVGMLIDLWLLPYCRCIAFSRSTVYRLLGGIR